MKILQREARYTDANHFSQNSLITLAIMGIPYKILGREQLLEAKRVTKYNEYYKTNTYACW